MKEGPTVVKLGGSLLEEAGARARVLDAIGARARAGERLVVVHGGGRHVDAELRRRGIERRVHRGLRVTDGPTRDVVVAVLAGSVSKMLVAELAMRGVAAVGLCGADGGLLRAERHGALDGVDLGWVGNVVEARPALLHALMSHGLLPLVASLAIGSDGELYNVNADAAAAAIAAALGAPRLVFLTDVDGLRGADGAVIADLGAADARRLIGSPAVSGGMEPKLRACVQAVGAGVLEVVIAGPWRHHAAIAAGEGETRVHA